MKLLFLLAIALMGICASASARPADCLLITDGKTVIDGPCDFDPLKPVLKSDPKGSFSISANGYFAQLTKQTDTVALGYWNGERGANHAHNDLGELKSAGACWQNTRSKICAWKPGERQGRATPSASPASLIGGPADSYCQRMASQALSFGAQIYKDCMIRMAQKLSNQ